MDKNQELIMLSASDRTALGRQEFSEQSTPQKVFSAIWAVEAEVNNGGFSQYFRNSSCETAGFVADAFEMIQAPSTAEICRRAVKIAFPNGLPSSPGEISAEAENFTSEVEDNLTDLDQEFYAYPHNLTDLLYAYVSAHPDDFGPVC
ncbi:MAG: DMP19 family protein [Acidobacteria bacterium]|nr:DMP19 family protein [Acidobacteriota bacterium]